MRKSPVVAVLAALIPLVANAQDPPASSSPGDPVADVPAQAATEAATAIADDRPAPGIPLKFDGLVDTYYLFNTKARPLNTSPALRAFDTQANSFTLNYARLGVDMSERRVGFRIDLGYGQVARAMNGQAAQSTTVGATADPNEASLRYAGSFAMEQAFVHARVGGFLLEAGRYSTSASDEYIDTHKNGNYSRSLLFAGVPFLHTGLRVTKEFGSRFALQLSVQNGFDNDPDNNNGKTVGVLASYKNATGTSLGISGYVGKERAEAETVGTNDPSFLVDIQAKHPIAEKVTLMFNGDYLKDGRVKDSYFWGLGAKALIALSPKFNLTPRFEYVRTQNGAFGGIAGEAGIYDVTLTGTVPIETNFQMRVEARYDGSDKEIFLAKDGPGKDQLTLIVGFLGFI
jgi:hypothetical protein